MLSGCARLGVLDLTGCSQLQALPFAFERLHGTLRSLTLNFVPMVTDQVLEAMAPYVAPLSTLGLAGTSVTDFGVQQILYRCHSLKKLDLYGCYAVTDLAFASVDMLCPTLTHLVLLAVADMHPAGSPLLIILAS